MGFSYWDCLKNFTETTVCMKYVSKFFHVRQVTYHPNEAVRAQITDLILWISKLMFRKVKSIKPSGSSNMQRREERNQVSQRFHHCYFLSNSPGSHRWEHTFVQWICVLLPEYSENTCPLTGMAGANDSCPQKSQGFPLLCCLGKRKFPLVSLSPKSLLLWL